MGEYKKIWLKRSIIEKSAYILSIFCMISVLLLCILSLMDVLKYYGNVVGILMSVGLSLTGVCYFKRNKPLSIFYFSFASFLFVMYMLMIINVL